MPFDSRMSRSVNRDATTQRAGKTTIQSDAPDTCFTAKLVDVHPPNDDYPDFVVPLAQALSAGKMDRGVAVCGRPVVVSRKGKRTR